MYPFNGSLSAQLGGTRHTHCRPAIPTVHLQNLPSPQTEALENTIFNMVPDSYTSWSTGHVGAHGHGPHAPSSCWPSPSCPGPLILTP